MPLIEEAPIARRPSFVRLKGAFGSEFGRGIAALLAGTGAGQLVGAVASLAIARLYTPAEYGILGVYTSLLAILTVGASLRYECAIPLGRTSREAGAVAILSIWLTIALSGVVGVAILIAGAWLLPLVGAQVLGRQALWLPVGVGAAGTYQVLSLWMVRNRDYTVIGRTKLSQSVGMAATQIGLGLARVGAGGLIVGQIIGSGGGILALVRRAKATNHEDFAGQSVQSITQVARRFERFPRYSLPAAVLDSLVGQIPLLYVAASFGSSVAGWLTLVQRLLLLPVSLLSLSMSQVYFGELAALRVSDERAIPAMFRRRLRQFALLGLVVGIGAAVVGPLAVPVIFGERWRNAGICLLIVAPMAAMSLITSPFGATVDVLERQDLHLLRDILRAVVIVGAVALARALALDWQRTIGVVSIAGVTNSLIYVAISWWAVLRARPIDAEA